MAELLNIGASELLRIVLNNVASELRKVLREYVLNIKNEEARKVVKQLRYVDELCRGRMIPMSSELIEEVRSVSKNRTPRTHGMLLKLALDEGLMDIVWGLIQCEYHTNAYIHFWRPIKQDQTAFDIALDKYHDVEVARLLLNHAHHRDIRVQWDKRRNTLLPLLNDPRFDSLIFDMLEHEKEGVESTSTAVQINRQGGLKIYESTERNVTQEFLDNLIGHGLLGLNGSNNTVLHLVSKIGDMKCVQYIIEKDHSQIYCHNSDTETPAYVAAREGRVDILQYMINILKAKNEDIESIVTRSMDKDTVLHIAIRNHHVEVIFLLIEEIIQLTNRINDSDETPLYLAAERGYFGVVELMLKKCKGNIAFDGPNGKTALHAAAISDSAECLECLLEEHRDLLNVEDKHGWTPLHYAVYHNSSLATRKLLSADYSIGYQIILENGINTSPIHIAARLGHCETMEVLMDKSLGCSEFIDEKGRNILHVAIDNKKTEAIEFIFRDDSLTNLINQKDKNGNTPIHLLVASDFQLMERLMDSRVDINALNIEKRTPLDMVPTDDQKKRLIKAIAMGKTRSLPPEMIKKSELNVTEWEAKIKKSRANDKDTNSYFVVMDNLVLVAALIATASFAAGFTVPGGFNSSDGSKGGTPFLLRKPAFQAFIITNAIAFSSSCSVLLGHIALVFYRNYYNEASQDEQDYVARKIENMYYLTTLALVAMTIAFVTGVYIVLTPSLGLAISTCVLCLLLITISMQYERFNGSGKKDDS